MIYFRLTAKKLVNLFHSFIKGKIHCKNNDCEDQGGNHYDDRAFLKFGPCRPGHFAEKLFPYFLDVCSNFIHCNIFFLAREPGLDQRSTVLETAILPLNYSRLMCGLPKSFW